MRTQDKDVKGLGRILRGRVSSSGGIVGGTGFSVVRNGTGSYTITFLPKFGAVPAILVTSDQAGANGACYHDADANGTGVYTINSGSVLTDSPFSFEATEVIPV